MNETIREEMNEVLFEGTEEEAQAFAERLIEKIPVKVVIATAVGGAITFVVVKERKAIAGWVEGKWTAIGNKRAEKKQARELKKAEKKAKKELKKVVKEGTK